MINVKHTPDFKDMVQKKIHNFYTNVIVIFRYIKMFHFRGCLCETRKGWGNKPRLVSFG